MPSRRPQRRGRYAGHNHAVATRPVPIASGEAGIVSWRVRPGDETAHAFVTGPGWMRSACRNQRWDVTLRDAEDQQHCFECADLVADETVQ